MSETLEQRMRLVSKKYMGRRYVKVLVKACQAELDAAAQIAENTAFHDDDDRDHIARKIRERAK